MFLARIDGNIVATVKHATLNGCRFLIAQRLEANGETNGDPLVVLDWIGASRGCVVLISTDGEISRQRLGNNTPGRLVVAGIVDQWGPT